MSKIVRIFGVIALSMCAFGLDAQEKASDFLPSEEKKSEVSYLLGVNFGSFIKSYQFGEDLDFPEIMEGIKDFLKAEGTPDSEDFGKQFKYDPNTMSAVFNAYLEQLNTYISLSNIEAGDKYMLENAAKEGVYTTESGLQYRIMDAGNEVHPAAADVVNVRYKGCFIDGTVFDENDEAISFTLNQVIAGWTEGLQLIGEGGRIILTIPPSLAYGEKGVGTVPPSATLIFDITLVSVERN